MDSKMTRRAFVGTLSAATMAALAACGGSNSDAGSDAGGDAAEASVKIEMVTDTGGVNDQSFNQLAWAGMQQLKSENGWEISYIESKQDADYTTIITSALKKVDEAVVSVSNGLMDGSITGGDNIVLGASEDAVGIAETHDKLPDEIYNDALAVLDKIKSGEIVAPATEADLKTFVASL